MTKLKKIKTDKEYKEVCKRIAQLEGLLEMKTTAYNKQLIELEQLTELVSLYEEKMYS